MQIALPSARVGQAGKRACDERNAAASSEWGLTEGSLNAVERSGYGCRWVRVYVMMSNRDKKDEKLLHASRVLQIDEDDTLESGQCVPTFLNSRAPGEPRTPFATSLGGGNPCGNDCTSPIEKHVALQHSLDAVRHQVYTGASASVLQVQQHTVFAMLQAMLQTSTFPS